MSEKENKEETHKSSSREIIDSIIVAFVIAIFIRTFFLGVYTIPTGSMLDTLQIGDFILVNKLSYKFSKPQHDDIVVFEYPLNPKVDFIKRVIGVPGDVIEIKDFCSGGMTKEFKVIDTRYKKYGVPGDEITVKQLKLKTETGYEKWIDERRPDVKLIKRFNR